MNAPTNQQETTALALAPRQQFDLSPQSFEQALTFSEYLAGSELVPKQFRGKPGDCLVAMQWGYEVNLKPLQALQSIAVINGKPGIFGDAGKAILLNAGCIIEEDDTEIVRKNGRSRCKITRPGRPPVERTFSVEDAKTANLWNKEGPWRTYPFRQMAWRAFWFAARDAASDLLRGLAGAEELTDMPAKDMGAADVVLPAATQAPAAAALPEFTEEHFQQRIGKIRDFYRAGKSADEIIAFYSLKASLPEAMQKRIRETAPLSFAAVADAIQKAANREALLQAADLIRAVEDEEQRDELTVMFEKRDDQFPE